ncbi:hypothetical protein Tco_1213650 [Tanacetum coccineum]
MENNVLKSGQHGQFSKIKSNEAKVKHDIDVIETINIELEQSVAKLLAENEQLHKEKEHLKQTYKDLFDSIKRTRVQTKDKHDSLMAQLNKKSNENADFKSENLRISKPWVGLTQVDVNKDLSKTSHYTLSALREGICPCKSHHIDCTKDHLADQASVFMAMMSVHISSGLVLHQMTSDHNRSELGIQDHNNEQSNQAGFQMLFLRKQDS